MEKYDFSLHAKMKLTDEDIPRNALTLEHLERISDGGGNRIGNLALACIECNKGRGLMDWLTYKTYRTGELYDHL